MKIWFSSIVLSACIVAGVDGIGLDSDGFNKTCRSPVYCSHGDVTERSWIEVNPTSECEDDLDDNDDCLDYNYIKSLVKKVEKSCEEKIEVLRSEFISKKEDSTPPARKRHENCKEVCDDVSTGVISNTPVGFATRGAEAEIFSKSLGENGAKVYCDCTNGSDKAWTVFQRRMDGSVNFDRKWADYEKGFGNIKGEFWLGLDLLSKLTGKRNYKLRIDLADWEGNTAYAEYSPFAVSDSSRNYLAYFGTYSGTAGDSINLCKLSRGNINRSTTFSTKDRDYSRLNCHRRSPGAWWYSNCFCINLNGIYSSTSRIKPTRGIVWYNWKGYRYSLKSAEMKIQKIE